MPQDANAILSPLQEEFARNVANGMKVGAAYAIGHPTASKKACSEGGSKLAKIPKVATRIAKMRERLSNAEDRAVSTVAKTLATKLLTMHDRRLIMAEIASDPKAERDTRMRAVMNDAKLAGELIDKQDLTTDGEALPSVMPSINLQMPSTFLARRGHSSS